MKKAIPRGHHKVAHKPARGRRPNDGYETGTEAEERIFRICGRFKKQKRFPPWLEVVVRGTEGDDANGIDALTYVRLASGRQYEVPLQIKTSHIGKKKFHAMWKWRHIPCVVVLSHMTDSQVFEALCKEVLFVKEMIDLAGR